MVATAPLVGQSVKRKEDPRLITGRGRYLEDITLPNMAHAAIVRSPHAHARIVSIDTSRARALPGVIEVYTGADMAKWIQFNLKMNPTMWEVPTVAETAYRPRQTLKTAIGFDEAGAMWGLGLAWVTMAADGARPMIVQKSGAGGGFMTYLAMAPGRDVGVFVAVNKVDFQMFFNMAKMANDLITNLTTR